MLDTTTLERTCDSQEQTKLKVRPKVKKPRMSKKQQEASYTLIYDGLVSLEQWWPTFSVKGQTVIIQALQALVSVPTIQQQTCGTKVVTGNM